jgi:hypothetical protein
MAKRKPEVRIRTWGIYTKWDRESRELPKVMKVTTQVPAEVDIEFGFVTNIRGAKNEQLTYCIEHPGILDADGRTRPPFDGTVFVKTNDWDFFLGDTIWLPIGDKLGTWDMWIELHGRRVAEKSFEVF